MTLFGDKRTVPDMRTGYGDNRISLRLAVRPFVDVFQFRGRSTRTEVMSFWLLGIFGNMAAVTLITAPEVAATISTIWSTLWGWPWIPLLARRLHDQNRTARWIALPLAAIAATTFVWWFAPDGDGFSIGFGSLHRSVGWTPLTILCLLTNVAVWFSLLVFYYAGPTEGANRYGPDPRLDPDSSLVPAET